MPQKTTGVEPRTTRMEGASMELFGHEVPMKEFDCAYNGVVSDKPNVPYVNLYVRLTDLCNANCMFCEFRSAKNREFDFDKFIETITYLNSKLRLNRVSFTGGEPTINTQLLNRCIKATKELNPKIFTIVNSNGLAMEMIDFEYVNSYSLSRHAIGDQANVEVFNCKSVIKDEELRKLDDSIKQKIHISCNLLPGNVDSAEKMFEFMTHYAELGFDDFGFVTLMEVNEFCQKNKVDFRDIDLSKMKNTSRKCTFNDGDSCFCANYITYAEDGSLFRWYARHYCGSKNDHSNLVFDHDQLKIGFNGPTIF